MRIGELADRAGVSTRSLRYYEEQGLIDAERTVGGQRDYTSEAVDRVRWIQLLLGAGLGTKALQQLLPCVYTGVATPDMLDRLRTERSGIDRQIDELTATRDRLDAVIVATIEQHMTAAPSAAQD